MEINRWWYSKKQKKVINQHRPNHICQVYINGEWCEYTEWTTSQNGKCNWDDAILIAESIGDQPIMVNGVKQSGSCTRR
jgi:hypothetical protein